MYVTVSGRKGPEHTTTGQFGDVNLTTNVCAVTSVIVVKVVAVCVVVVDGVSAVQRCTQTLCDVARYYGTFATTAASRHVLVEPDRLNLDAWVVPWLFAFPSHSGYCVHGRIESRSERGNNVDKSVPLNNAAAYACYTVSNPVYTLLFFFCVFFCLLREQTLFEADVTMHRTNSVDQLLDRDHTALSPANVAVGSGVAFERAATTRAATQVSMMLCLALAQSQYATAVYTLAQHDELGNFNLAAMCVYQLSLFTLALIAIVYHQKAKHQSMWTLLSCYLANVDVFADSDLIVSVALQAVGSVLALAAFLFVVPTAVGVWSSLR